MAMPPATRSELRQLAVYLGVIGSPVAFFSLVRVAMLAGWGL